MSFIEIKKALGQKAAQLIENGMIVGLGSGSTAECFIQSLIYRVKEKGISIQTVASSSESAHLAQKGGLPVLDINDVLRIDLTIDGADEIDPQKQMIKGAGGALLREKILASASEEMIVIADESKLVSCLGQKKLPIEILPFGSSMTYKKLETMGFKGTWRLTQAGNLFMTDNGNYIFDIHFDSPPHFPEKIHEKLIHIPGVIETGFFFNLAKRIFIGYTDGHVKSLA